MDSGVAGRVMTGSAWKSRDEAVAAAGVAQADAIERLVARDPREAALAAHVPGGLSVEELEVRIRAWHRRLC